MKAFISFVLGVCLFFGFYVLSASASSLQPAVEPAESFGSVQTPSWIDYQPAAGINVYQDAGVRLQ